MSASFRFRSAFTMIELLMAVAIIAVLAALLLPTVMKARTAAEKASCMSRIRQIGIALGVYALDSDDTYPPVQNLWHTQYNWSYAGTPQGMAFLWPDYLPSANQYPSSRVLSCPCFEDMANSGGFGYSYNGNKREYITGSCWDPPAPPGGYPYAAGPGRIISSNPNAGGTNTPLVYERILDSITDNPYLPHPRRRIQRPGTPTPDVGGGNVVYADGHVAWLPAAEWSSSQNGDTWRYNPVIGN
jgi:prepilin-type N-terminal cleavage/methylation domain-containing protein/prepilin-type processing-associated H-X9-DG protein